MDNQPPPILTLFVDGCIINCDTHHMRNRRTGIFWIALMTSLVSPLVDANNRMAVVQTSYGSLKIELFSQGAPQTVEHFIELVQKNKYQSSTFYRVVKGNFIQGGIGYDVARKEQSVKGEASPARRHTRGAVGFARQLLDDPDSGTTEIYICVTDLFRLDELGFTVFGQVVEGWEVLDAIANVPVAEKWKHWVPGRWEEDEAEKSRKIPWHQPVKPVVIENITLQQVR
jgi:cyclophilin family peptidyl-prolyl cis-trans isomerase